eukprot:CAMPEP_0115471758 /NCGR_PEP_ID=MMETSP0271-20121206/52688_1 /TAXON_ID=71861 /ORGANISM="Scrippsiella trochoidea, Strain CCMP3099" /LENGTH=123 /DNA_ID=CAMNT_0002898953 /DNA_START=116 /DNA_END=487 /DNA_ORIENTATION=-
MARTCISRYTFGLRKKMAIASNRTFFMLFSFKGKIWKPVAVDSSWYQLCTESRKPPVACTRGTARLVARGHQKKVRPCDDLTLHVRAEPAISAYAPLPPGLSPHQHVPIAWFAVAHHDKLNVG